MGQIGFFDLSKRYTGLDAKNEPLAKIDEVVPWEDFRGCLDAVCRRSDKARKSRPEVSVRFTPTSRHRRS